MLQALGNLLGNAIKFTPSGGSVTLRVADAHHGTIEVDSEPGAGSTFSITLPKP